MAELRSVDPRTLQPNPNNPRRTPVPPAMDEQLLASINAIGIIHPPYVTPKDDGLMIVAGRRRVKAAIKAELPAIEVLVCDADEVVAAMRAVAENLVRASMTSVDIWRAIERLEAQGWNEQAIGDALALPVRTVPAPEAAGASASADARRDGARQHAERGAVAHDRDSVARGTGASLEEAQAEEGPDRRGLV